MNQKNIKKFFIIAGILTLLGSLPVMFFPRVSTHLLFNFTENIPQKYLPIIRHWAVMAVGLGGLLIAAASHEKLRFPAALFSTASKLYVIGCAVWFLNNNYNGLSNLTFGVHANYSLLIAIESLLVLGGVYFLGKSSKITL